MKWYVEGEAKINTVRHVQTVPVWQGRKEGRKRWDRRLWTWAICTENLPKEPFTWSYLNPSEGGKQGWELQLLLDIILGKETVNTVNRNPNTCSTLGKSAVQGPECSLGLSPAIPWPDEDTTSPPQGCCDMTWQEVWQGFWECQEQASPQELSADFTVMMKTRVPPRTGGRRGPSTSTGALHGAWDSLNPQVFLLGCEDFLIGLCKG